jgi:sterol desaturase/sphingolipid hydroxylase (fatty acid hydroxylase superfamily)
MPPAWLTSWMDHEGAILWRTLIGCFIVAGLWELFWPVHPVATRLERRWSVHAVLFALATGLLAAIAPLTRVGVSLVVARLPFGLLNQAAVPFWIRCVAGILLLDMARYWTHWLMHSNGWMWRIHLLHHTDEHIDITTGFRFHPLEEVVGVTLGMATIALTAAPPASVFLFEVVVAFLALAAHANASLPVRVERFCRTFVITPDLHRIHHSVRQDDQNKNLGVIFPFWDRLFGTYRELPAGEASAMTFGLEEFPKAKAFDVPYLLASPFVKLPSPEAPATEPASRQTQIV